MKREVICTVCPNGCVMKIEKHNNEYKVEGNGCKRGEVYGIDEVTSPKRVVTSTVKLEGSYLNMLPVKTNGAVPKEIIFDIIKILSEIKVISPIKTGEIIIENILNTGINIVSTKTL